MLIALIGESGCGKSTIERMLESKGKKRVISSTSRKKRKDEKNGVHYFFYERAEMEKRAANGEFLEYQTFNGELYGVEKSQLSSDYDSVIIVAFDGLKKLKRQLGNKMISVYIKVSEDVRFNRMIDRKDHPELICQRLANDKEAFEGVEEYVDFVINGEQTTEAIVAEILSKIK